MNPKLLILLLVIALISVWQFFVSPIFDSIDILKKEIVSKEKEIASKEADIKKMKSFEAQLEDLNEERERMEIALPSKPNIEELMIEFEALVTKKGGMALNSINITPIKRSISSNQKLLEDNKIQYITIKLNVQGSYDALKRVLILIQKDLRLMDVQKITFSARPKEKSEELSIYDFSIDIQTYYY
jgi:Tfp pilus assembly protein PilO